MEPDPGAFFLQRHRLPLRKNTMTTWDAQRYQARHNYIYSYGESLIEMLAPFAGERILDLGCGSGQLTAKIAECGAEVIGMDRSPEMLAEARRNFPALKFEIGDAANFELDAPVDAVFSNAALHWVKNADGAAQSIARALRKGGRFVAEFGGKGNVGTVLEALPPVETPWYFPSVGEYAPILERHGFEISLATLFDRPTRVEGEDGFEDWLKMFASSILGNDEARREVVEKLRPKLYRDGGWVLDYRRLRVIAVLA
jgi:SAM-dependent methyltransferase